MSDTEYINVVVKITGVFIDDLNSSVQEETILFARHCEDQAVQDVQWLNNNARSLPKYNRTWNKQDDITDIYYRVVKTKLFHSGTTKDIINE